MQASALPSPRDRLEAARLYWITPELSIDDVLALARVVLPAVDVVQVRQKMMGRGELLELAREMRRLADAQGKLLIVDDHVDIALLASADGAHLGPSDLPLEAARKVAGQDVLIGASAGTPDAAREAAVEGADYIGCGPVFATPVKAEKTPIGPEGVAAVQAAVTIPVFAIGGIDSGNLSQLTERSIRRVCVIRSIAESQDPLAEAQLLRSRLG